MLPRLIAAPIHSQLRRKTRALSTMNIFSLRIPARIKNLNL